MGAAWPGAGVSGLGSGRRAPWVEAGCAETLLVLSSRGLTPSRRKAPGPVLGRGTQPWLGFHLCCGH